MSTKLCTICTYNASMMLRQIVQSLTILTIIAADQYHRVARARALPKQVSRNTKHVLLLHICNQRLAKFTALHFLCAFHQTGKVVGDNLLANRLFG